MKRINEILNHIKILIVTCLDGMQQFRLCAARNQWNRNDSVMFAVHVETWMVKQIQLRRVENVKYVFSLWGEEFYATHNG